MTTYPHYESDEADEDKGWYAADIVIAHYMEEKFTADQVLTLITGPADRIGGTGEGEFGMTEDDPMLHEARYLYNYRGRGVAGILDYDYLKRYLGDMGNGMIGPKMLEGIFAAQLNCAKEVIESCMSPKWLGIDSVIKGTSRLRVWDDDGDYLSAAMRLSLEMHDYIVDYDLEGLVEWLDEKVRVAGEMAMLVSEESGQEGGVIWENWEDAAMVALGDYGCDGVCDELQQLMTLMMALKYYDNEGS